MTPRSGRKPINLGDTARLVGGTEVGTVTGTMTLQPTEPNPVIKRSVCVQWHDGAKPSWHRVEDVVLVSKAKK